MADRLEGQTFRHPDQLVFFLGGQDLEMVTIRELLITEGLTFHDWNLNWAQRCPVTAASSVTGNL